MHEALQVKGVLFHVVKCIETKCSVDAIGAAVTAATWIGDRQAEGWHHYEDGWVCPSHSHGRRIAEGKAKAKE